MCEESHKLIKYQVFSGTGLTATSIKFTYPNLLLILAWGFLRKPNYHLSLEEWISKCLITLALKGHAGRKAWQIICQPLVAPDPGSTAERKVFSSFLSLTPDLNVNPQGSEACRQAEVWIQAQWEKIFLAEGTLSPICCSLRWNIFKVKAFGESGQWTELNALAKTKKSPIGFAPFLDVCLKQVESVVSLDLWYYLRVREHKLPSTSHCWVKRTD